MTCQTLKNICDERGISGDVCGKCSKWGNQHTDDGRPVYTLKCDNSGAFTPMDGTCADFME